MTGVDLLLTIASEDKDLGEQLAVQAHDKWKNATSSRDHESLPQLRKSTAELSDLVNHEDGEVLFPHTTCVRVCVIHILCLCRCDLQAGSVLRLIVRSACSMVLLYHALRCNAQQNGRAPPVSPGRPAIDCDFSKKTNLQS